MPHVRRHTREISLAQAMMPRRVPDEYRNRESPKVIKALDTILPKIADTGEAKLGKYTITWQPATSAYVLYEGEKEITVTNSLPELVTRIVEPQRVFPLKYNTK